MFLMNRLVAQGTVALGIMLSATALFAQTLKVSAIPDEAPTELARKFKPLGDQSIHQKHGNLLVG